MKDKVFEKLRKVLFQSVLLCSHDEFTPNASLVDDLGCDSLDIVEICLVVEEEFGIPEISENEADSWKTVGGLTEFIRSKAGANV